jgi:transcription initiation factor TFIID TATA-box-binding protein
MKWKYRKLSSGPCKQVSSAAGNLFAELEYIADTRVGVEDMAQVHNLVGTSRIASPLNKLDLRAISNILPNAKFEKQKFAAITIRLGQPVCTVLLFTSGKMVLTGCKSMLDCILASTSVYQHMRQGFPGVHFQLEPVKIQNIVGNAQILLMRNEKLDLHRFYSEHNIFCTYQPNMFPGLIYRPSDLPIVLLIFFSGKVVITGAKTMADVYCGWKQLSSFLKSYKTQEEDAQAQVSAPENKSKTRRPAQARQKKQSS